MSTSIALPAHGESRARRFARQFHSVGARALTVLMTLLGLLALTFVIGRVMPLDPVLSIVGPDADRSTYEQVYRQLGLDKPLWVQFGYYLRDLLHDQGHQLQISAHTSRRR